MTAGKKIFLYKVYAMLDVKVPMTKGFHTRRDIQIMAVTEDSSQAAGKKYVNMINKSKTRRLINVVKIEKMK